MTYPTPDFETTLLQEFDFVFGVDEVGRGAIAGPLAVGVCLIGPGHLDVWPSQIRDSKLLNEQVRTELAPLIQNWAPSAVGLATVEEIENFGVTKALAMAARRGVLNLAEYAIPRGASAIVLLDGTHNWLSGKVEFPVRAEKKADQTCVSVAAASVVAKVHRDRLMAELAESHPQFDWQANKGYASPSHIAALQLHGPSPQHRLSWLSKILADGQLF